jgi:ribosomal protein L12E/L44/L45/RPP1/RPP2
VRFAARTAEGAQCVAQVLSKKKKKKKEKKRKEKKERKKEKEKQPPSPFVLWATKGGAPRLSTLT